MSKNSLLLLMVIVAMILAACGPAAPSPAANNSEAPQSAAPGAKVQLTLWSEWSTDPAKTAIDSLIKQFNDSHPNIEITHRAIENEQFFTVLRTGFTSNEPPDLFQHEGHNNVTQFVRTDQVEDISDFWAAHKDRFLPGTEASIMWGDKYYGIPWSIHTDTQIYYNEDILAKNGIDPKALKTWDDYLAAFDKLKSAGITPLAFANKFGWSGGQFFLAFLVRQVGAERVLDLAARNCGYKWTDPDIVAAAKYFTDLSDKGYMSEGKASDDYPAATALFFSGKAGFFHTGSWFIPDAQSSAPPGFKLGMNIFPTLKDGKGDPKNIVMQGLEGLSISKKGASDPAKRAAMLTFFDWLTQLPQAQYWVKNAVVVSPIRGAATEETANPLLLRIVKEEIEPNTGSFPFVEHIVPKTVGEEKFWMGSVGVLTGQLNAQTWMQSIEDEAAKQPPTLVRDPTTCSK
jgi:raffinose/stachyose/melibiose transport system substrate-binding protein